MTIYHPLGSKYSYGYGTDYYQKIQDMFIKTDFNGINWYYGVLGTNNIYDVGIYPNSTWNIAQINDCWLAKGDSTILYDSSISTINSIAFIINNCGKQGTEKNTAFKDSSSFCKHGDLIHLSYNSSSVFYQNQTISYTDVNCGYYSYTIDNISTNNFIRPVIALAPSKIVFEGSGLKDDPYIVSPKFT